jgi:3-deoxy-D-manno-octulosonate 8-phosphate phosphatase (KDO 8-P phosphatase)
VTGRAAQLAEAITLVVLDVDGVLTDGAVTYGGGEREETKSFNIKDGLGIKLLQQSGIDVAIITGRVSDAVKRRAAELGISMLVEGREDKGDALRELLAQRSLSAAHVAYMGDDLPDLSALRLAGLATCPSDAAARVLREADWVASRAGGTGAVRELSEFILQAQGKLERLYEAFE